MTGPFLPPARLFVLLGVPAGLALALLTPPFQVPDEPAHLFRAYQIAEGSFRAESLGGPPGGWIPSSLVDATTAFPPRQAPAPRGDLLSRVRQGFTAPAGAGDARFVAFASAPYSPVAYLPAAAALAAGKAAGWPALALLYAGRLATLFAAMALHALALRVTPAFRWPLALLALTPMAAFQRSGLSADGVTNGLAFLFFALVLRLSAAGGGPPSPGLSALVVTVSAALALCKGSVVLLPLLLLVPARPRGGRGPAWTAALLGAAAAGAWAFANRALPIPPRLDVPVDAAGQLRSLLQAPGRFLGALGTELSVHGTRTAREFLGQLGWLDVRVPVAVLVVPAVALVVLAASETSAPFRLSRRWRVGVLAVLGTGVLSVFGGMYVLHTPAGALGIEGIQGRYFIPFAPAALFLLVCRRPRPALSERSAALVVVLAVLVGLGGAAWAIDARFVAPSTAPVPPAARLLQSGGCPLSPRSPSSSNSS